MGFPAGENVVAPSPVSPLDLSLLFSPKTPSYEEKEEREEQVGRRATAVEGFYCLRASPLSTPTAAGGSQVPELLPLFPLTSPTHCASSSSS